MLSNIGKAKQETTWLRRSAWVVLAVGTLASVLVCQRTAVQLRDEADQSFKQEATQVTERLDQQLDHYIALLGGFQSMFLVSADVDRKTFHTRYAALNAPDAYPSLMAVHFAQLVKASDKTRFEAAVRADRSLNAAGQPGYQINPAGERADYLAVKYVEPRAGNERLMGFDSAYGPARGLSMARARDTGRSQISPPTQLIRLTGGDRWGFVVRLPVYQPGAALDTPAQRRQAYIGQIAGVFRASDLMREVLAPAAWKSLNWRIVDTGPSDAAPAGQAPQRLFDSAEHGDGAFKPTKQARAADITARTLNMEGRAWRIEFVRPHVNHSLQPYPLALLAGGLLGSLGLWWALCSAASRHQEAATMALRLSHKALASEHRLRSVIDHTVDGIVTIAPSGIVVSVNQAMCRIFGHPEHDMVLHHLSRLMPAAGETGEVSDTTIDDFLQVQFVGMDGLGRRAEGRRANGELFPLDLAVSTMELDGERQYIGILRDLSTEREAEQAIMEAHRQLNEVDEMRRVIVHHAPYAILMLNRHGVIQTINPAGETLLGYKAPALVGKSTTQHFFDPDQVAERAHMLAMRNGTPVQELEVLTQMAEEAPDLPSEWNLIRMDGRRVVVDISVTRLNDDSDALTGYLVMAQDVTQRREAERQVEHMALHDALTALPNRDMLQERLKTAVASAQRDGHALALMFLDIDRFKKINDTLGHHIGDSVLIEVARRLRVSMRTSDIVARLGGDEFVILLPYIADASDGERVAQKIIEQFAEPLWVGPHELRITPSIGLVLHPHHGDDAVTLMRHADLAMYQAKSGGRNRVQVYSDAMESPTADTLVLENELYKAMERDELRLHFQPQFDSATGNITGAEALVRWEHGGKLIPPADFIPLAEESGLIVPMGEWVLRRACERAQQWRQRSGWPLRMAVNLSAVQLDQPGIAQTVADVLRETGLPPTALELEITESVVVRESLRAADILSQLRALGVSIAIDDFGVGYSSFAYLRELPVDRFKLDRSFLTNVPHSAGDSRLTAALIAMAHRLEVGIVAEGVETAEQNEFLRAHGCDECQGYFLGRPMKEEAFEALLMEHSRARSTGVALGAGVNSPDSHAAAVLAGND